MFEPAKPVSKKLKVLVYGDSGSGKTRFGLTFPNVAVIDTENGTDLYAGRPGVEEFKVLRIKTMAELDKAIDFVRADGGKTIGTLFIDSMTVFYDVLLDAKRRTIARSKSIAVDDVDLGYKERASINMRMKGVYAKLTGLPVHVVVTAREADLYSTSNGGLQKIGTKPDLDKSVKYMFDYVLQMNADHSATVVKSRGSEIKSLKNPTWKDFEKLANLFVVGEEAPVTSEEDAAEAESKLDAAKEFQDRGVVTSFFQYWNGNGVTNDDVLAALGVTKASEWTQGRTEADKAVRVWREAQAEPD